MAIVTYSMDQARRIRVEHGATEQVFTGARDRTRDYLAGGFG